MNRRKLGSQGLEVSAQGLGCLGMSYGSTEPRQGIATIHRALELGITHLDTAEVYGPYVNEELVGRAIAGRRERFEIATKFGFVINPAQPTDLPTDGSAENVRRTCEASLQRLGIDHLDLYYQNRTDVNVPIEETVGAMAELVHAGKVRYLGLSEASADTIRRAHATHPISAVQSEYSLWTRDPEDDVLPVLRELGIGLVACLPLGRGFLTGQIRTPGDLPAGDWRRTTPRFQPDALRDNLALLERVLALAERKGTTPAQLALAWVASRGDDIVPLPGTKNPAHVLENARALDVALTAGERAELDAAMPRDAVRGERYPAGLLALVNR